MDATGGRTDGSAGEPAPAPAPAAFTDIYRDHHGELARLAFLLTGSAETAQDIVQDAFVKAHARWADIREPVPYLRRSVVNGCHSHHRRGFRARELPVPRPRVVGLEADELADALAKLPRRQRSALVLRFYYDLSEADTAAALGCRPGTVGSLVHRGLAALREVIHD